MSYEALEHRVGELEREQTRQGERLGHVASKLDTVASGVEKLLERDAKRPEAVTLKSVAATCTGLAAIALVVWWLIDTAPAVRDLRSRMDHAEWKYGWAGRVERAN